MPHPHKTFPALLASACLLFSAMTAQAADGLIAQKSSQSVSETLNKFEQLVSSKGMKIFARINHAAGAESIGQTLRPTELLVFGNPKGGTPLMQCSQSFAIDLPLKALAWEDADGQVWLGVNDLETLASRHGASDCPAVAKVKAAVGKLVAASLE